MKTKLLKNEEDILFYGWVLEHYINTSFLFLFFSRTWCLAEIVSSRSNTCSCWSLPNYWCLFQYWYGSNLPTSMILYVKTITLKNDSPSKMTNFQRDLFFKRAFLKMKALNFISYIVDNIVCDLLIPYLK